MRRIGRVLIFLMVTAAAWLLTPRVVGWYQATFAASVRPAWKLEMVEKATVPVGYLAEKERWLNFTVAGESNLIRIVSHANLANFDAAKKARANDPQKRWTYSLEFQVLDKAGNVLLDRTHHHRADIAEFRDASGRMFTPSYYLDSELTPTSGIIVNLNLAGMTQAARVRIRSIAQDAEVADILVRVYVPEQQSEQRLQHLWQRLNEKQKSLLSKGSVAPHEMLTEEERINLLRNTWQPVGPEGVRDTDFKSRSLYVLQDKDGESLIEPIQPFGIPCGPQKLAVFSIPEQGGEVRFQAQAIPQPGTKTAQASLPVALHGRWYGRGQFARETFSLSWQGGVQEMKQVLKGGLVEIGADTPLVIRAFMDVGGKDTEITPEHTYQRLYVADHAHPVSYRISHFENDSTPLHVQARYVVSAAQPVRAAPVLRYAFFDANGSAIKSGTVKLDPLADGHDQHMSVPQDVFVTKRTEFFFSVPPAAKKIRIDSPPGPDSAANPVLVTVFNRPPRLAHSSRTPEDEFAFGAKGQRVPAWFVLHPEDYERLIVNNRSRLVLTQARPLDDKPEVQAGRYMWDDIRPASNPKWTARELLVPREAGMPQRDEALVSTYTPIESGHARTLDFPVFLGVENLTPRLLWQNEGGGSFSVTVHVDGKLHHGFGGKGHYGAAVLPPITAGRHTVRIAVGRSQSHAMRFYVSHAKPGRDAYVTRVAAQFAKTAEFVFDRKTHAEETLTARIFQPGGWRGRTRLRMRVLGPKLPELVPLPGWLFEEREYDIRPDTTFLAPVFDTEGRRSDAGQPAFVVFPENFPRGRYRLHFSLVDGPPGYLALSSISTELTPKRLFIEEPFLRN